jgi:DNA-binding transcriptional regulator YdaS (Cro superfamily)
MKTQLEKAIGICGGQTALANAIGVQQPHIWNWLNRKGAQTPVEYCALIEQATNGAVTRKDLRPDDWMNIWPELAEKAA